jgi:hypothetical protein
VAEEYANIDFEYGIEDEDDEKISRGKTQWPTDCLTVHSVDKSGTARGPENTYSIQKGMWSYR